MELYTANETEWEKVRDFYWQLIDSMDSALYKPGWKKGIYPSDELLMRSIRGKELYVLLSGSTYAAAMILNHKSTEGYEKIRWSISANPREVTVVHALGVLPAFQGQGIAKFMVREAIRTAGENGQKAVRLDVLGTNIPAQKLYSSMGFQYRDTIQLFYEDTGLTDYMLYEYLL